MKRPVQFLAAALTAACLSIPANAQGKVGVIDLQKVFDNFWRTKQADVQIKDRLSEFEKMGATMFEDYKKAKGAAFNLREFHDDFVRQGGTPIKIIRKLMIPGNNQPTLPID